MKTRILTTILLALFALSFAIATSADGITKRVKFAKGKSSTVISGAVIRGDVDTYIVGAKSGQKMTVKVTALEDNAAFTIEGPDGNYVSFAGEMDDATNVTATLPATGNYRIEVGGTRGNATYKLTIAIK